MFSKSILSNYMGSVAGLAFSKGLRFVAIALCVRMAGDYSWGQVVSTLAAFAFIGLLLDQGLGASTLLFRMGDRDADDRLLRLVTRYRALTTLVFLAGLHAFHHVIHPLPPLALLYSLVLIPRAFAIDWWFHRRELFQFTQYIASARTFLFLMLALALVKPGVAAATIIAIELASEAGAVAFGWLMRAAGRRRAPAAALISGGSPPAFGLRELLFFSLPFLAIGLLNTVQASADVLMIRAFLGNAAVAEYDVGLKVAILYFFVGAAVVQIIRPKLARLNLAGEVATIGRVLRTSSGALMLVSGLLLIPSLYFSEEIVSLLFGYDREVSSFTFRWAGLWVGTSFLTILCADTLLSLGRRRDYVKGALLCAVANVGLNLVFLNVFGGFGAIVSKILAEAAFLAYAWFRLPAAIRRELFSALALQAAVVAGISASYFVSTAAGFRLPGLVVAMSLLGAGALAAGTFTRKNLAVLREN